MDDDPIIEWLLKGDVAIQYQVHRDLLGTDRKDIQQRIPVEGWGKQLLSKQRSSGHWGKGFYQPKWISTHYTLLEFRELSPPPLNKVVTGVIELILQDGISKDGGIPLGPSTRNHSDVCVNGMFLNYASYFRSDEHRLRSVVDSLLKEIMPDGGFNCQSVRSGATHSSLHSTISVLEGFNEFRRSGYTYRKAEIRNAVRRAEEFILQHQLFLSDRTGKIISKDFLRFTYPCRWKYDILRALDYFQQSGHERDSRMEAAIGVVLKKRNKEGSWNMQAAHPGQVHFNMEQAGRPGRWNTLRALRVLKHFGERTDGHDI